MERQRIGSTINLILIGAICGIFGAIGTHAIYDIVPAECFTRQQRYLAGAFVLCGVVSAIVLKASTQMKSNKALSND